MTSHAPAALYPALMPRLVEVARQCGYALAVHGSAARDLDLIAAPWQVDAAPADELIEALRAYLGAPASTDHPAMEERPHFRRSYCLHLGGELYLDVAVLPRAIDVSPAQAKVEALRPIYLAAHDAAVGSLRELRACVTQAYDDAVKEDRRA